MAQESTSKIPGDSLQLLRIAALFAVLAAAAGSVGFTLWAGRNNHSLILPFIFVVWVLSPFIALLWAYGVSGRWSVLTRTTLYRLMLVLAPSSVAIYGYFAFRPPKAQAAFVFVIVPPASWLLSAVALWIASLRANHEVLSQ